MAALLLSNGCHHGAQAHTRTDAHINTYLGHMLRKSISSSMDGFLKYTVQGTFIRLLTLAQHLINPNIAPYRVHSHGHQPADFFPLF